MSTIIDSLFNEVDDETHFVPDLEPRRASGLRLLCLHGHASNNDITSLQIKHLLLQAEHGISCDLFCAFDETGFPQSRAFDSFSDGPYYTWFNHKSWITSGKFSPGQPGGSLHESLRRLMALIAKCGPYDGVYGFSQGGFMAAALCNRTVWSGMFGLSECPFRFALLANSALDDLMRTCEVAQSDGSSAKLALPIGRDVASLHLIGQRDHIRDASEGNASHFADAVRYTHDSSHEIPMRLQQDAELQATLASFFSRVSTAPGRPDEVLPQAGNVPQSAQPAQPAAPAEPLPHALTAETRERLRQQYGDSDCDVGEALGTTKVTWTWTPDGGRQRKEHLDAVRGKLL